jgi:hypothetical protein
LHARVHCACSFFVPGIFQDDATLPIYSSRAREHGKKLRATRGEGPAQVLDAVVSALFQGRGYYWVGIYLTAGEFTTERVAARGGAAPSSVSMAGVNSEIVVPIRLEVRKLGLIIAETGEPQAIAGRSERCCSKRRR